MLENAIRQATKVLQHYEKRRQHPTERETIDKLVLPFIEHVLGADYQDPAKVTAEFDADIGRSKGEKVDYAICRDGEPVILIECKALNTRLDDKAVQLQRYIGAIPQVSLGILTDGRRYRFFADLDNPNILDEDPFLNIDLLNLDSSDKERLNLFHLDRLNVEKIKHNGRGWKTVASLVQALEREWKEPSNGYITHFAEQLHGQGPLTETVHRQYASYLQEAQEIFFRKYAKSSPKSNAGGGASPGKPEVQPDTNPPTAIPQKRWRPLTELNPTELKPQLFQFENGPKVEIKSWAGLFRAVACKLASEGRFKPVPDALRNIVRAEPASTSTPWLKLPDGQHIRNHGSATDRFKVTVRLLSATGYDPAKCNVQ